MKNKKTLLYAGIITTIILIILLIFLFFIPKQPVEQAAYPEIASPVRVRILRPTTGAGWPLNYDIPIHVSAWGSKPISKAVLYINGVPIQESLNHGIESEAQEFLTQFNWQPGGIGEYILTVQAYDEVGGSGISNPVVIETGGAAITGTEIEVNPGSTLEQIAIDHGVAIEEIQLANPDMDPKVELTLEDIVFIPNPPVPLNEINLIPPLDPNGSSEQNSATPADEPGQAINYDLPYAPIIYMKFEGCDVKLRLENIGYFNDSSDPNLGELTKEDGFYVYRSRDGGDK
jgi:LysM repeat protein